MNTQRKFQSSIRRFLITKENSNSAANQIKFGITFKEMEKMFRSHAKQSKCLKERIRKELKAATYWAKGEREKENKSKDNNVTTTEMEERIPLQATNRDPIFVGGDVIALYPSLDGVSASNLASEAVKQTNIMFEGIDYRRLAVYLNLVLVEDKLCNLNLRDIIPERRDPENKSEALSAKSNKDLSAWVTREEFTQEEKKLMIAAMVQTMTLLMMATNVYSFAGDIYLQSNGAGIGLRAAACLARICMCIWDSKWATMQNDLGLSAMIFMRYVDDLRIHLFPINKGWFWSECTWKYDPDKIDTRSDETRTKEELNKSFNDIFETLKFTTETQEDFSNNMLPTLDFQVSVEAGGKLDFMHFTKPMCNNLVLEVGTALSQDTVFNSLKQDCIRRLLNTRDNGDSERHLEVVEDFIKLLVDSGHRYSFIKSIIQHALTKYEFLVTRSQLNKDSPKYQPLYRHRSFNQTQRTILKYISSKIWYQDEELGDTYRRQWKKHIVRKSQRGKTRFQTKKGMKNMCETPGKNKITSVIFVPASKNGILAKMIKDKEEELRLDLSWGVKVLEKPGLPLINSLSYKFPVTEGCPEKETCEACDHGDGIKCAYKNVVYQAMCEACDLIMKKQQAATSTQTPEDQEYEEVVCEESGNVTKEGEHDLNLISCLVIKFRLCE